MVSAGSANWYVTVETIDDVLWIGIDTGATQFRAPIRGDAEYYSFLGALTGQYAKIIQHRVAREKERQENE